MSFSGDHGFYEDQKTQSEQDLMMRQLAEQAQADAQARFDAQLERQAALEKAIADQKAAEQINTANPISGYSFGPAVKPINTTNPISGYSFGPAIEQTNTGPQALDPQQRAALAAATSLNVGSTFNDMYKPTPTAGSYIPGSEPVVAPTQETGGSTLTGSPVVSTTPGYLQDKFGNPVTSPVSGVWNTPNTSIGEGAPAAGLVYGGPNRGWYAPVNRGGSEGEGEGSYTGGYQRTGEFSGMPAVFGGIGASAYARGGIAALASGGMNYDQTDPYAVSLQQKAALGPTDPAKIESLRKLVEAGKKPEELPLDPKDPYYSAIIDYLYGSAPNSSAPTWSNVGGSAGLQAREIAADPNAWHNQTPQQKAAYYVDHPGAANFQSAVLSGWGMTIPGMIQNKFDPGQMQRERDILARADEARQLKNALEAGAGPVENQIQRNAYDVRAGESAPAGDSGDGGAPAGGIAGNYGGNFSGGFGDGAPSGGSADGAAARNGMGFGGEGSGREGGEGGDARGGYLNHGRFDQRYAYGGIAALANGGYNLGSYSDGGRLLRGPGDGVSDNIPATIGHNQPARLADGEFVVPARIVSELGNGSTEAGARKLYAMMDRVQKARGKTVGKNKIAANSRADKYLPA